MTRAPLWKILALCLLWIGALGMMLPFWVMVSTALSDPKALLSQSGPTWFPWPLHWENFQTLFETVPLARYFWNSLWVASLTTLGHVFCCATAAYAFSRLQFPGKGPVFLLLLLTLMIPPQVNIVPLFFLMKELHWVDTGWGLVVPGLFGAFGVFLLRQWFNTLPKALEDAAMLDGCNPWQTFWHVILPISKPPLAALALFVFIGSWNNFMWPLIVLQSDSMRTLPVGIAALKESFRDTTNWALLMAASTVSIIPILVAFTLCQKQFIQGLFAGSVKE